MRKFSILLSLWLTVLLILSLTLVSCVLPSFPESSSGTTTTMPVTTITSTAGTTQQTSSPLNSPTTQAWTPPAIVSNNPILPDFVSVVSKVKPSVVAINVEIVATNIFGQSYTDEGAGSGWILDSNGLIVTNNHVIEGARNIAVTFDDGTTLPATVVGSDSISDLAVLKVDKTGLPAATIGDSTKLRVGDNVLAIGNALGEGISATSGIISRTGASIQVDTGSTLTDLLQTDAAINPGNSGGPLVNMAGEVIGITSAKLAAVGVEGIGYAISTATALPIIQSLVQKGYVVRPYLGVQMETVNQFLIMRYRLSVDYGAFIVQVVAGSPASAAGLKAGDVIVSLNNKDIKTANDAIQAIRSAQVGQAVEITYWRGNNKFTTTATLAESPVPSR